MSWLGRSGITGLLVLVLAAPGWSDDYTGTWEFTLSPMSTTCSTTLDQSLPETFRLVLEQDGRVLTGYRDFRDIEGIGESYAGCSDANGFSMSMTARCPVVPDPVCSNDTSSFSFERNKTARKQRGSVVWTAVDRNARNQAKCVTVYTGKARKLLNKE